MDSHIDFNWSITENNPGGTTGANLKLAFNSKTETLYVGDPGNGIGIYDLSSSEITQAVNRLNKKGIKVASAHLTFVNPFPDNTGEILSKYKKIIIPELNAGQLIKLVRDRFLIDAIGINKVSAEPFTAQELVEKIEEIASE